MPKVLISDKLSPRAAMIFKEHGIDVDAKPGLSPDELKAVIADYDGLAIRSATKVTVDILNATTNLKVVGRAGIGVDNVDIAAATKRGVIVMNTPHGNAVVTAFPWGVFITITPRLVAAAISTLSTPMPARPITFRFVVAIKISAVTFVAERIASPS